MGTHLPPGARVVNNRAVPTRILLITGDAGESYECLYARHRLLEAGLVPVVAAPANDAFTW